MLSIYKYNNGRGRKGNGCSATYLNGWVQNLFQKILPTNGNFMKFHLLHQVDFPCNRKLLFDNIERDFDELMEEHGLNLTLSNGNIEPTHMRRSKTCSALAVNDFDSQAKKLITTYYGEDLVLYNELLEANNSTKT